MNTIRTNIKVAMLLMAAIMAVSCGSSKLVSAKKLSDNAENAVRRAQNVASALKLITLTPDIPLEDYACVVIADSSKWNNYEVLPIKMLRSGTYDISDEASSLISNSISLGSNYQSVEAGKYYYFKIVEKQPFYNVSLIPIYNANKLERAKKEVAGIKEYIDYRNVHPKLLDGIYKQKALFGTSTLVIKDNRIYFSTIYKGIEFIYDGETIILLDNGKYESNSDYSNILFYRFNKDGNLEIVFNAKKILTGLVLSDVFTPAPDNSAQ